MENTIIKAMSGNFKACVQNGCMSSSLLFSSLLSSPPLPLNLSFLYSIVPRAQRAAKHHCIPSGTTSPIPPFFLPLSNTITLSPLPLSSPLSLSPLSPLPSSLSSPLFSPSDVFSLLACNVDYPSRHEYVGRVERRTLSDIEDGK